MATMAAPSKAFIPFLIGMMLLTGVCNTLITKYQDNQCVRNCQDPDTSKHQKFEQPVWQTAQMFVGEMGCWLVLALSKLFSRMTNKNNTEEYEPLLAEVERDSRARGIGSSDFNAVGSPEPGTPVGNPARICANCGQAGHIKTNKKRCPLLNGTINGEEAAGDPSGSVNAANPATTHEPIGSSTDVKELTGLRTLLLAMPAVCDIIGTTLMNTGLLFVVASIYQMTRGVLVLFVGLFSVWFLNRKLSKTRWFALVVVVIGVGIVGLSGMIEQKPPPVHLPGDTESNKSIVARTLKEVATNPDSPLRMLFGMSLIFLAQMFTASQFVLEESIMHSSSIGPLQMVAFEGTFGLILTLCGQIILHLAYGNTASGQGGYFDMSTGWHDIVDHRAIWSSSLLIMVCIGSFNFFGLSVTRNVSATSRSTIDTCRVLFVWLTSLGLGWERFRWLQVLGFALLVYGTFLYNEIVSMPGLRKKRSRPEEVRSD